MIIVGVGKAGGNICELFADYSQYRIVTIDNKPRKAINKSSLHLLIKKQQNPEKYEEKNLHLFKKLKNIKKDEEVLLVVCGSCALTSITLAFLEGLYQKQCKISILYIVPDRNNLNEVERLQEKVSFCVMQEYARSGLFERMFIVSNKKIAQFIGNVPVKDYFSRINALIATIMHSINIFQRTTAVMGTSFQPAEVARIATLGMLELKSPQHTEFFEIQEPKERHYFYALSKKDLTENENMIYTIEERIDKDVPIKSSYQIFEVDFDESIGYTVTTVHEVQPYNIQGV